MEKNCQCLVQMGKDFVQIKSGPFDIDLVFAPDGIENYEEIKNRAVWVGEFPVAHIKEFSKTWRAIKGG